MSETEPFAALSSLALSLSWADEAHELLGMEARPLSLVSRDLVRLMGLRLLDRAPAYESVEDELADLQAYAWIHTASLEDVCDAMRTGGWRAVVEGASYDAASLAEILPAWRERRALLAAGVAAVEYEVRPRPPRAGAKRDPADEPPSDVIGPTRLGLRAWLLQRETGVGRVEALWHYPYCQAVQICHAAQWWERQWTVPAMERTGPVDFGEFELGEGDGER